MAIYLCGFESGTLGGPITTSGGDASPIFDSISSGFVFDNTHVWRGSAAALLPTTSTGTQRMRWNNGTRYAFLRGYFYLDTLPTTDTVLTSTADAGAGVYSTRAYVNIAGKLRLGSKTGSNIATHTVNFPINQYVRVEHYADAGTSAADGKFRVAYYLGDSTTPEYDSGLLTTNVADATGIIAENRIGASSSSVNVWFDAIKAKTSTDAVWGTDVAPAGTVAPVVTVTGYENNHVAHVTVNPGTNAVSSLTVSPSATASWGTSVDKTFILPHVAAGADGVQYTFTAADGIYNITQTQTVGPDTTEVINIGAPKVNPAGLAVPNSTWE